MDLDIWDELAAGNLGEATRIAKDDFDQGLAADEMITLCACYLWRRDWDSAYEACRRRIESTRWSADSDHKFAGTAKWCAGDRAGAVAEWKQGINVQYADIGGGISIPLHLYFAAALDPELASMDDAIQLIQLRLKAKPCEGWPGYLTRLVLDETTWDDAVAQIRIDANHLWGEQRRLAEESAKQELTFWWGVKLLTRGDTAGFRASIRGYGDLSWAEFDRNKDVLVDKLRSSEFHLARSEASVGQGKALL